MFNKLSLTAVVVLIAVAFCLFTKANADCSVVGAYVSPQASLVLTHASNSGECKEWLFGPITETRVNLQKIISIKSFIRLLSFDFISLRSANFRD
jgi:hypothetical protein